MRDTDPREPRGTQANRHTAGGENQGGHPVAKPQLFDQDVADIFEEESVPGQPPVNLFGEGTPPPEPAAQPGLQDLFAQESAPELPNLFEEAAGRKEDAFFATAPLNAEAAPAARYVAQDDSPAAPQPDPAPRTQEPKPAAQPYRAGGGNPHTPARAQSRQTPPEGGRPAPQKRGRTETPEQKAAARTAAKKRKQLQMGILIGAGILVLVVAILLAALIPGCVQRGPASSSSAGSSSMVSEEGYDKDANSLPLSQLAGTVLAETEDAGEAYVAETLFIGDSNTARMIGYRDVTGVTLDNAIGVEGMGIQAVTSLACVKFIGYNNQVTIPEAVKLMQPRRIIISFGTNDVGGLKTETFIDSYTAALDAIHGAYPYADIIIGGVLPVAQKHINQAISMSAIDKYNVELAKLAETKGFKFLNWSEALKDENTGFCKNGYMLESDGIHLNRAGMEALFTYLRTHSHIAEDTRPKPLEEIPKRVDVQSPLISSPSSRSVISTSGTSSSASSGNTVKVVYTTDGNGSVSMSSTVVEIGAMVPSATATPNSGYAFSYWSCSTGSIPDNTLPTLSGLRVPTNMRAGDTLTIVANFVPVAVTPPPSSEAPPPSSSQAPSLPPSQVESLPVSTPEQQESGE